MMRQTVEKEIFAVPREMPATTESTSIPVSTTQHKKVCLRRQSLSFFSIVDYWKHSGWKSFANFSMVLAVMELANTSHRVME